MARKRGGIAGFYDRNKGILKKAVPAALSFIPGVGVPLAAVAGAAMGADTEGKGYFSGFNVGGAVKGGIQGYGVGRGTQALAGGARSLLAPKAPDISGAMGRASGMIGQANQQIAANPAFGGMAGGAGASGYGGVGSMPGIGFGLGGGGASQPGIPDIMPDRSMRMGRLPMMEQTVEKVPTVNLPSEQSTNRIKGLLTGGRNFMRENKDLIEMAGKGVQRLLPNPEIDIAQQKVDLEQAKFDEERRLTQMEEERRRRIAQFLMPYAQQNFPQYFGGQ